MADSKTLNSYDSKRTDVGSGNTMPIAVTLLLASLTIMSGTGCSAFAGLENSIQYNECCNDFMLGYRNSAWSARAWQERKHCFQNQRYKSHFKAGFRQGYEDVASGGNGCTPSFPPRSYWGWQYQSPEGQLKVAAWFAGYPMGAKAAEEDCLGYETEIRSCGELEQCYQQHGLIPGVPAQPMAQPHPSEPLPGMSGLLSEGESIVGEVKVQADVNVPTQAPPVPDAPLGLGLNDQLEHPTF